MLTPNADPIYASLVKAYFLKFETAMNLVSLANHISGQGGLFLRPRLLAKAQNDFFHAIEVAARLRTRGPYSPPGSAYFRTETMLTRGQLFLQPVAAGGIKDSIERTDMRAVCRALNHANIEARLAINAGLEATKDTDPLSYRLFVDMLAEEEAFFCLISDVEKGLSSTTEERM